MKFMKPLISTLLVLAVCGHAYAADAPKSGTFTTTATALYVPTENVIFKNTPSTSPSAISPSWETNGRNLVTGQSFVLSEGNFDLEAVTLNYRRFGEGIEGHDFKLNIYKLTELGDFSGSTHLLSATGNLPAEMDTTTGTAGMLTFTLAETDRLVLERDVYYLITFGFGSPTGAEGSAAPSIRLQTVGDVANAGGGYRYDSSNGGATFPAANLQVNNGLEIYLHGTPAIPESSSYALGCGIVLSLFIALKRAYRRK